MSREGMQVSTETKKWLKVTAELVQDGQPVALPDGTGVAHATRQVLIDDLDDLAHKALPEMVERAFEFPGLNLLAGSGAQA